MRLAVAQIHSLPGQIEQNKGKHLYYIEKAVSERSDLILFPELSLTNYEPKLARKLAVKSEVDNKLAPFRKISREHSIRIVIGVPFLSDQGIHISLAYIGPDNVVAFYHKNYLHTDEQSYFIPGTTNNLVRVDNQIIQFGICYEISVGEHHKSITRNHPTVYMASVAKSAEGIKKKKKFLSNIAKKNRIPVMLSNSIGPADHFVCAGGSAIWDARGYKTDQLSAKEENLLIREI